MDGDPLQPSDVGYDQGNHEAVRQFFLMLETNGAPLPSTMPVGPAFWGNLTVTDPDHRAPGRFGGLAHPNQSVVGPWKGPSVGPLSDNREEKLMQLMRAAIAVHPNDPILQRITVAQAVNENGWDIDTGLARHNNLFGIKGHGTAGSVNMGTWEVLSGQHVDMNDNFAANNTVEDSFLQHARLLQNGRYAPVRNAQTFEEAADALLACGYGTDPRYPDHMKSIDGRLQYLWAKVQAEQHQLEPQVSGGPLDIDKGIATLRANTVVDIRYENHPKKDAATPTGNCSGNVRVAYQAMGLDLSDHPDPAADYAFVRGQPFDPNRQNYLTRKGFTLAAHGFGLQTGNYKPQRGDWVVWNVAPGHANGHAAMFDGNVWISDFIQNNMAGLVGLNNSFEYAVYRFGTPVAPAPAADKLIDVALTDIQKYQFRNNKEFGDGNCKVAVGHAVHKYLEATGQPIPAAFAGDKPTGFSIKDFQNIGWKSVDYSQTAPRKGDVVWMVSADGQHSHWQMCIQAGQTPETSVYASDFPQDGRFYPGPDYRAGERATANASYIVVRPPEPQAPVPLPEVREASAPPVSAPAASPVQPAAFNFSRPAPVAPNVPADSIVYYAKTGQIVNSKGELLATAASGRGIAKNDPGKEGEFNAGPVPRLTYNLQPYGHNSTINDNAIGLDIRGTGQNFPGNRDGGFLIHEEKLTNVNYQGVYGGSHGCIGITPDSPMHLEGLRDYINTNHITHLVVLTEPPPKPQPAPALPPVQSASLATPASTTATTPTAPAPGRGFFGDLKEMASSALGYLNPVPSANAAELPHPQVAQAQPPASPDTGDANKTGDAARNVLLKAAETPEKKTAANTDPKTDHRPHHRFAFHHHDDKKPDHKDAPTQTASVSKGASSNLT